MNLPSLPASRLLAALAVAATAACAPVVPIDSETPVVMVPAGMLPPPGACRVWYPDRTYTQQPSPGACDELRGEVPAGAYLIRG